MNNTILKKRTIFVILITLAMMIAEIYYGIVTHSMAMTADGFHMGTHVFAFTITLLVCFLALKYQDKTEKLNALGGYTSAILLGFTSLGIMWESGERLFNPLSITFSDAILVAIIGLVVNLVCIFIMGGGHHTHFHNHEHICPDHEHHEENENLNYKAAYFHILADIMTSILAIFALLSGKFFGWVLLDPIIGFLGGIIIAKWAIDLIVKSFKILLDM